MRYSTRRSWVAAATIGLAGMALHANAAIINFDDVPAGRLEDQYFSQGVRFLVGNGEYGSSTGVLSLSDSPVMANVGDYGTSISAPYILNPGGNADIPGNSDIIVHFFDAGGARTLATSVGVQNDTDGNPFTIYIEGFNASGVSLGRTQINGASAGGVFSDPAIYFAKIYPESGQAGFIGVDNFSYTLVPSPSAALLGGVALLGCMRRRRALP